MCRCKERLAGPACHGATRTGIHHQHHGLQVVVDHDGEHRVLEAAHVDRLIVERVFGPAQPPHLRLRERSQPDGSVGVTISTSKYGLLRRAGIDVRRQRGPAPACRPRCRASQRSSSRRKSPGQQGPRNLLHQPRERRGIAASSASPMPARSRRAGIGPAMLDPVQARANWLAASLRSFPARALPGSCSSPCAGQRVELAPLVDARTGRGKHRREVACAPDICRARHWSLLLSQSE